MPPGATLTSLALGDPARAEEIRERNTGRPAWTQETKNRPDGPLGWIMGLFGVPEMRQVPKFAAGDPLPQGEGLWLPRDLDPAAPVPPGFRRIALPLGDRRPEDLTGGDPAWAEALARANPDLSPEQLARGGHYINLPGDLPVENGLPVPPDSAAKAPSGDMARFAKHVAHRADPHELDPARGIVRVRPGDTLKSLAKLIFDDESRWAELRPARDAAAGPDDDLAARGRAYVQVPAAYAAPDWGDVEPLKPVDPFLKKLAPAAARIQEEFGIPAAVVLAQAAAESAMGESKIGEYNVFGIKGAGSRGSIWLSTSEYHDGTRFQTHASFADFGSWDEALRAHAEIFENPVYEKAMNRKTDPKAFARALTGKYATDPHYGDTLIQVMREQNLIAD